jgi:hypothetical protein
MSLLILCCAQMPRLGGARPESLSYVSTNVVPSLLGAFKQVLQEWKTWNIITMMQNHGKVKKRMLGLFYKLQVRRGHFFSTHVLHVFYLVSSTFNEHLRQTDVL